MQKFSGQAVERKSHNRGAAQENRKCCHKAACGDLNPCLVLLVLIQKVADISVTLVIDKPEFFRYDVLRKEVMR